MPPKLFLLASHLASIPPLIATTLIPLACCRFGGFVLFLVPSDVTECFPFWVIQKVFQRHVGCLAFSDKLNMNGEAKLTCIAILTGVIVVFMSSDWREYAVLYQEACYLHHG